MGCGVETCRGQDQLVATSAGSLIEWFPKSDAMGKYIGRMLKKFVQRGPRRVETGGVPQGYIEDFDEPMNEAGGLLGHPAKFWLCRCPGADAASLARHGLAREPGCSVAWSWVSAYEDK